MYACENNIEKVKYFAHVFPDMVCYHAGPDLVWSHLVRTHAAGGVDDVDVTDRSQSAQSLEAASRNEWSPA